MTTKTKTTKKFVIEVIGEQVKVNKYGDKLFTLIDTLGCLLYTSPSPRDLGKSRMPSSA